MKAALIALVCFLGAVALVVIFAEPTGDPSPPDPVVTPATVCCAVPIELEP